MPRSLLLVTVLLVTACLTPLDTSAPPELASVLVGPQSEDDEIRQERRALVQEIDAQIQSLNDDPTRAQDVAILQTYKAAVEATTKRDEEGAQRESDVIEQLNQINYKCRSARYYWEDKLVKWGAKERKLKVVFGAITGGVGTVGGAIAGISAGVDEQDVAAWSGGATAVLGLAGTLATTFVAPDKDQVESAKSRIAAINAAEVKMGEFLKENPGPAGWDDDVLARWAFLAGQTEADCDHPAQ